MKKQIKVTSTVSKELVGIEIAKYLLSIGPCKETNEINKVGDRNERETEGEKTTRKDLLY